MIMKLAKLNLIENETEIIKLQSFTFAAPHVGISKIQFLENGKIAIQQDGITDYFSFKHIGKYYFTIFDIVADIINTRYLSSAQAKNIISVEYFNQQKTFTKDWYE